MSGPSDATLQAIADHARTASREALEEDYIRLSQRALVSDLAALDAKREAAERAATEAAEQARVQREAAAAERRETLRHGAWLQAFTTRLRMSKPDVAMPEVIEHARTQMPQAGWPEEHPESSFYIEQPAVQGDDIANTYLGQLLAKTTKRQP